MQMKEIKIEDLDHDTAFKVRLEIALLENARRIRDQSMHPDRFAEYIASRSQKISELLGIKGSFEISENGKIIFTK